MPTTMPEPISSAADEFLGGALKRIRKYMVAVSAAGLLVCLVFFRWPVAAGFLIGAGISYVNQRWLERAVDALGERVATGESKERGGGIVFRAVLRYAFIALGAYVIFNVSRAGLYGFLGGVCLPIVAVACEVAVEVFVTLRRGF
ncbi:MAG: ATP synthase subunit I [Candidatus Korobacteraceae bacterium]